MIDTATNTVNTNSILLFYKNNEEKNALNLLITKLLRTKEQKKNMRYKTDRIKKKLWQKKIIATSAMSDISELYAEIAFNFLKPYFFKLFRKKYYILFLPF